MNTTPNLERNLRKTVNGYNLFIKMEYYGSNTLKDFLNERLKPDRNKNYDIIS